MDSSEIDIGRVKYFLKQVVLANKKLTKRDEAREELDEHIETIQKDFPKKRGKALDKLNEKIDSVLRKEREIMTEHLEDKKKIEELEKIIKEMKQQGNTQSINTTEKPKFSEGIIKQKKQKKQTTKLKELREKLKELENIHKKLAKQKSSKKTKETIKKVDEKITLLKNKLKKAK